MLAPWRKAMTNLDSVLKSRDITLLAKGLSSQSYGFSSSQVWMWETIKKFKHWRIDAFKLWCWRRLLKVPWIARRPTQNIHWKDWCWSSNTLASWCEELTHRKDPDAGKDWGQEEKGTTEDEMVGWHHRLNGHGFEQAPGAGEGQGSLVCCSPWGCKESGVT